MILELIGAYFFFLIILLVITEYSQKLSLGVITSVLIIPLALWILVDGVQINTGIVETYSGSTETNTTSYMDMDNMTISNSFAYPNVTITKINVYSEVEATPGLLLNTVLGVSGLCLGLFGIFHYILRIMDTK